MTSLLVTSYTPALGTGRAARTYGIVRALAARGPVDVLYARFGPPAPDAAYTGLDGVRLHEVVASRGARRALTAARAVAAGVPPALARGVVPELGAAAAELASGRDPVVADDPMAAVALSRLARRRPVVYSAHNLESAFRSGLGRDAWGPRPYVERFERRLLEGVAEAWMPSRADLDAAARLAPRARLRLVPNVVDVAAVDTVPTRPAGTPRTALMVADYTYPPNREGFGFLVADVLPRVWERAPDLRVRIVGRGLEPPAGLDPRVSPAGFVEDLEAEYAAAGLALVPLLTGGGSPLKFVEALAHGLPVVATPRAAAGLDVRAGEHYLEGAGGAGFADAVLAALDPARAAAVGAAGRALAEREYSIEALTRRLAA